METTATSNYDLDGELSYSIEPDGYNKGPTPGPANTAYETSYSYYDGGQLETTTTPGGFATSYTYDDAGNVLTETDPTGVTTNAYDTDSRVCWTYRGSSAIGSPTCGSGDSGAPSGSTKYSYLADTEAPLTVTDPDSNTTTYTYGDPAYPTQPTTVETATGKLIYSIYDAYGNPCLTGPTVPSAAGCAWVSGDTYKRYDASGNVLVSEDPNGNITTYSYSDASFPNSVTSETDPLFRTTSYSYDADGRQIVSQDPSGNIVSQAYDPLGRPCWQAPGSYTNSCASPPTGSGVTTFSYDAAGNRIQMVDNNGNASLPGPTGVASPAAASGTVGAVVAAAPASTTPTISSVGSFASHDGTDTTTLGVSPAHVGDLMVLAVKADASGITASSVSGGGVSSWTRAEGPYSGYSSHDLEIWTGPVTSTGSSTITVSFSGSVSGTWTGLAAQEFSSSAGASTTWGVDNGAGISNSSSGTVTYPSLTPAGSGELYFGYAAVANTGAAGSTSGFSYATTSDGDVATYDANVSGSVSPTASQSPAGVSGAIGVLLTASGTATGTGISAVGSDADHDGTGITTLSVSPSAVGDALVLSVKVSSASVSVSSVSGGGATGWTKLEGYNGYSGHDLELWMGKITSTGSSTVTVGFSGSVSGLDVELVAQEFSAGLGAGTQWSPDSASGQANASSSTVNFPSLDPTRTPELYVGYASVASTAGAGSSVGYTYDTTADGNLFLYDPSLAHLPLQATSSYAYDADGQLTSATDDNAKTVSYLYNPAGDITCIAYPISSATNCLNAPSSTNTVVDRNFDAENRLASTTDWLGNTVQYGYSTDGRSNVTSVTYPTSTGESITYGYDAADNLLSADYAGPAVGSESQSWTPNADELVGSTSQLGGFSSTYTYDGLDRVQDSTDPGSPSNPADTYAYNANGELASITPPGGSSQATLFSYDNADELTLENNQATGAQTSFAYSASGERCRQETSTHSLALGCTTTPSVPTTTYAWDSFGQLCWTGVTTANSSCSSQPVGATGYSYDGDGLRMSETPASGSQSLFTWDMISGGSIPLLIDDGTYAYVYGPLLFGGSAPVEQINLSSGAASYMSSTPSGVQLLFSQSGGLINRSEYSTFGVPTNTSPANASRFGFEGSYTDPSGLQYLVNRYYDPSTGQFISVDPMVESTGYPYAFTGDNPINGTDPLGLGFFSWVSHQWHRVAHFARKVGHAIGHAVRVAAHFVRKHWKAAVAIAAVVVVVAVVTVATAGIGDAGIGIVAEAADASVEAADAGTDAALGAGADASGAGQAAAADASTTADAAGEGSATASGESVASDASTEEEDPESAGLSFLQRSGLGAGFGAAASTANGLARGNLTWQGVAIGAAAGAIGGAVPGQIVGGLVGGSLGNLGGQLYSNGGDVGGVDFSGVIGEGALGAATGWFGASAGSELAQNVYSGIAGIAVAGADPVEWLLGVKS